jgi:hypothetical protein
VVLELALVIVDLRFGVDESVLEMSVRESSAAEEEGRRCNRLESGEDELKRVGLLCFTWTEVTLGFPYQTFSRERKL